MEDIKDFASLMKSLGFKAVVIDEHTNISLELSNILGDDTEASEETETSEKTEASEKTEEVENMEKSEEFENIETSDELEKFMTCKHSISRRDFNYACDAVVENWADELTFNDIFKLARFTSAVRARLFQRSGE